MRTQRSYAVILTSAIVAMLCTSCTQQAKREAGAGNTLLLTLKGQRSLVSGVASQSGASLEGEIRFAVVPGKEGLQIELSALRLMGGSIKTRDGESGHVSVTLSGDRNAAQYDPAGQTITAGFTAAVHYPLIDRIKGYQEPLRGEKEKDDIRSYTEEFAGKLVCRLREPLQLVKPSKQRVFRKGAKLQLDLTLQKEVLGEIRAIRVEFEVEYVIVGTLQVVSQLNVRPVFIRYTPEQACCCGGTTATTGGSYETLREKALEIWDRCCIKLNFLPPVYVNDDNYRVLASAEAGDLRAEYDDTNAIEVFFVEVSDPVGLWGGGVCYSGGTANSQIITFDTNLPINLYNLAHELGHALGLWHPPGNSTAGSVMEPSGFCVDNPPYQSDQNCDNANNPLLTTTFPFVLCWRNTNMP